MKIVYRYHVISPNGEELEVISSMPKNFKYRYGRKTLAKKMLTWYKKNIACPELFKKTCIIIGSVTDADTCHIYVYPHTIYTRIDTTPEAIEESFRIILNHWIIPVS